MKDAYKKYLQRSLKKIRIDNGLDQAQMANRCYMDKSYISKIENQSIEVNLETLTKLYKEFQINIIIKEEVLENMERKLDDYYKAVVFYNPEIASELIEVIKQDEINYLNSRLVVKYMITKYISLVMGEGEALLCAKIQENIEALCDEHLPMSAFERQIFLDYKGLRLRHDGKRDEALLAFEEALNLRVVPFVLQYGMLSFGNTI